MRKGEVWNGELEDEGEREGIERGSLYALLLEGWKMKIRWRMESLGADGNHWVRVGDSETVR
jgi:hypothetical protein